MKSKTTKTYAELLDIAQKLEKPIDKLLRNEYKKAVKNLNQSERFFVGKFVSGHVDYEIAFIHAGFPWKRK